MQAMAFCIAAAKAIQDDPALAQQPLDIPVLTLDGLILATAGPLTNPRAALYSAVIIREKGGVANSHTKDEWNPKIQITLKQFIPYDQFTGGHRLIWATLAEHFVNDRHTSVLGRVADAYAFGTLTKIPADDAAAVRDYIGKVGKFLNDPHVQIHVAAAVKELDRPRLQ